MMTCYVYYLSRTFDEELRCCYGPESPLLHLPPGRGEVPPEGPSAGTPAVHARDPAVDPTSDNHAQHPPDEENLYRKCCAEQPT